MNNPLAHILEHKVFAIVRGADPKRLLHIAQALHAGGVRMMEVTLNSPGALASIEEISGAMEGKMLVGAGTVLDPETARAALLAVPSRAAARAALDRETIGILDDEIRLALKALADG